jgi:iron(III) transport system permease protein
MTKTADTLTMFPLVVPGTVLGIAMVLAFNGAPFYLNGTAALVISVWVIRRLPYTIRSTTGVLHNISVSVEEAAQSLGANPFRTFLRVTFPMIFSGVLPGALLSFIASITELSASLMVYNFKTVTMSIKIYSEICKGNFGVASAMSTILLLSAVVVLGILFKVSKGNYEFTL